MSALLRTDIKLLRDALASNGGGVNDLFYANATIQRMVKAGLIAWKTHPVYLVITPAGKEALKGITP